MSTWTKKFRKIDNIGADFEYEIVFVAKRLVVTFYGFLNRPAMIVILVLKTLKES